MDVDEADALKDDVEFYIEQVRGGGTRDGACVRAGGGWCGYRRVPASEAVSVQASPLYSSCGYPCPSTVNFTSLLQLQAREEGFEPDMELYASFDGVLGGGAWCRRAGLARILVGVVLRPPR